MVVVWPGHSTIMASIQMHLLCTIYVQYLVCVYFHCFLCVECVRNTYVYSVILFYNHRPLTKNIQSVRICICFVVFCFINDDGFMIFMVDDALRPPFFLQSRIYIDHVHSYMV